MWQMKTHTASGFRTDHSWPITDTDVYFTFTGGGLDTSETQEAITAFTVHCKNWKDPTSFALVWTGLGGPTSPKLWSFSEALVVKRLLVACCSNCTPVDGVFLSKSLYSLPNVPLGKDCGIVFPVEVAHGWFWSPVRSFGIVVTVFSSTRKSDFLMPWQWHDVIWM